ncbi:hypothetical protein ES707_20301 [subsurface metagenome]
MGKILVLGASPKETRFSYKAVKTLIRLECDVVAVGKKEGDIRGVEIQTGMPQIEDVDDIILYLSSSAQVEYYDYIVGLKPGRVIFNPGTYNQELIDMCKDKDIEPVVDCALIMLNSGTF